ncbi:sulfotransferase [Salipiger bermudensis]|uniref:sulfotransferase family protein n=1 Tax=Salipiger bermudensis TaxID=344736 RepID=UPI001C9A00D1|nr:sulfotransferase [Salipiger bermudensis]MBY6005203.1 sulfotransferase [Salipiger bermudensis]
MSNALRTATKSALGATVATALPQCGYDRCIFILAHMRCGSTALSNILCTRPDVSGYGEAHVRYDGKGALGRLVVNQALRKSWKPGATHLFDKILHNRHDEAAPEAFFRSFGIFVARRPAASIRSICKLYRDLGRDGEYPDHEAAAIYYLERLHAMHLLWDRFAPERRFGITHAALLADPEAALAALGTQLALSPPLENRYESHAASRKGGGGDPFASGKYTRIEARADAPEADAALELDISPDLRAKVEAAYARFEAQVAGA